MTQGKKFWVVVGVVALSTLAQAVHLGVLSLSEAALLLVVIGLCAAIEEGKVRLIWQTPRMFQCAGLYLKVGGKRYRIYKVGLK